MKKTLIALAVFGTFTGAALADGNSVTLYGIIDLGVTHFTGIAPAGGGTGTVSSTGLSSGVQSGSRIGVKGTEDLGGGLKAIFDAETGFCAAGANQGAPTTQVGNYQSFCTGGGYFMGRQAYAGLAGDFGTVLGGRLYTTNFDDEADVDPFGAGLTGQIDNMSLVAQYNAYRANQVLAYVSPNFSGFNVVAAYVFAPNAAGTIPTASGANSNVSRAYTIDGKYAAGPIMAGLTYTQVTNVFANAAGVNDGAVKLWDVRGAYDFGVAKISGIYENAKQDYSSGNNKFWSLGVSVPVGPGAILGSYAEAKNDIVAGSPTGKQVAIGYTYNLSKRTNLYTSYAHISNSNGASFVPGDSTDGFKGVANQGSSGFALGIRHQF